MTRNLVLLFAAIFVPLTALDLATTWVAVLHMGHVETNPYTDLSSVEGLVIPEIITLCICMAMVALGAELKKTTLHDTSRGGLKAFIETGFGWKQFPTFLVLIPMVFAVLRAPIVLSNTSIILTGYGLFIDEEFSHLSWNQFVLAVCGAIVIWPTFYLIYRVCRASTP